MVLARAYNTVTKGLTVTATTGGASSDVVYACPANFDAEIDFLHVTNGDTANHNISLQWYHADTNTYYHILNDKSVAGKDPYGGYYVNDSRIQDIVSKKPSTVKKITAKVKKVVKTDAELEMVRARDENGHFIADDPDTEVNEAWVVKTVKKVTKKK